MGGQFDGYMDGQDEWMFQEWVNKWRDEQVDYMDSHIQGWMYGMDRQTDGQNGLGSMNGWMDGFGSMG